MTDPRVAALRYEQLRPFHPGRLLRLLNERVEPGEFGTIIRSAGFCRLATRPRVIAEWNHVGSMFSLEPLASDDRLLPDDEILALGQDLAVIGLDLRRRELVAALDEAALTDREAAAGPTSWAEFSDPFPAWHTADEHPR
nr:GTP-binding protein [Leucobacter weissii]